MGARRIAWIGVAAGVLAAALGCAPAFAQAPADDKAIDDCQSDRPARAVRGCSALLARVGDAEVRGGMRANVLANRAESLLSAKDAAAALADADAAIAIDRRNDRAHAARGRALAALGRDGDAVASFTTAIGLDPRTVAILIERAEAYGRLGQDAAAEADFREAIRRRFNRPEPYLAHAAFVQARAEAAGDVSPSSPRMAEAKRDLDKAVEYGLVSAPAYAARALWSERVGADADAMRDLDRAIAADETYGPAYLERGRLNVKLGRADAARQDAGQAVFKAPDGAGVVAFAQSLGVPTATPAQAARLAVGASVEPSVGPPKPGPVRDARPRVALVIGNGTYKDPENALPNALNDAHDVSVKLASLGFEVMNAFDQGKAQLTETLEAFDAKAATASAALVYYAGHGIGENGRSFIVPVDADLSKVDDMKGQLVDVARVVFDAERVAPVVLVFLDACRTPPTLAQPAPGAPTQVASAQERSRALAAIKTVGQETLVVYATTPGRTASDGAGRNSPFTRAFLANAGAPGVEVQGVVKRITREVRQATGNRQSPESVAQMASDFYFVGEAGGGTPLALDASRGANP